MVVRIPSPHIEASASCRLAKGKASHGHTLEHAWSIYVAKLRHAAGRDLVFPNLPGSPREGLNSEASTQERLANSSK